MPPAQPENRRAPGPEKQFDQELALELARDLFWKRGFDGTSISELESALGVGRKSLYNTFGSKRELYLLALEQYTNTVIHKICLGLADSRNGPLENLERVLNQLQRHHSSPESLGCLLGVAMAEGAPADVELSKPIRGYLRRLERAFESTVQQAIIDGSIDEQVNAKDTARQLVALTQGLALMGRVKVSAAVSKSIVRATLRGLNPNPKNAKAARK